MMGVVSMFSDMTHEGARSVYGDFLGFLGVSAATIGLVSGLGELIGYAFRLVTGFLTDRLKNYWTMTFVGYAINMLAIPALALVSPDGWKLACALIVAERVGKAIRHPAKNTLVSFAATQIGAGKSFAVQEFLDQLGAFLGPVILFVVGSARQGSDRMTVFATGFAVLGIPAFLTLLTLALARRKYPQPEAMETSRQSGGKLQMRGAFVLYLIAISLLALGFADFPLITMHIAGRAWIPETSLPLLYAGAMAVDALAALFFGWLYDRSGVRVLMISSLVSAFFSFFIFYLDGLPFALLGIALWGIGMGAQESILKAVIVRLVPKDSRSTGFGVFQTAFGISWFAGSWLMGALYDRLPVYLVILSVGAQLVSVPFFYWTAKKMEGDS